MNETLDQERGDDMESALSFLQPSEKPGSLGRLAHYEVLEVLGNGGFGTVVKAFDEKLHRFVAIKLMSPFPGRDLGAREAVRAQSAVGGGRPPRECDRHLRRRGPAHPLSGHGLYRRANLAAEARRNRSAGAARTCSSIGRQIAAGLAAAHAMGLIHRDIKPGNILLEDGVEHVKITDFGLARAADDASITQSGFIAGTPMYMAPEQAQGEPIDQRADLFSLGSVLYTMCSGRPPFRAANTMAVLKRVVEDTPRPIREIIPEIPEWLCELISRLHAKNPADRIISAQDVADLLARRLAELQGPGKIRPRSRMSRSRGDGEGAAAQGDPETRAGDSMAEFFKRRWAVAAAVLVTLFGCLGFTEATGVTDFHGTVIRLLSPEGTLVVEVDDPGVSVKIDGPDIVITGAGAREIRLQPGRYTVEATKNGKLVRQELVTVTKNGRQRRAGEPGAGDARNEARDAVTRRAGVGASRGCPVRSRAGEGCGRSLEGAQSRLRRRRRAHHRERRGAGTGVQHG